MMNHEMIGNCCFFKQLPVDFLVPQVAGKKSGRRRKVGSFAHSHVPGTLEAWRFSIGGRILQNQVFKRFKALTQKTY